MLELKDLRRSYGDVRALDGLTFAVPAGQVFGFLGPNGAGKTTAMRAVFGVVALDGGEIRWGGAPVGPAERRRFGYMPEERGLYPEMGLLEQLEYLGRLHGMAPGDAREAARRWSKRLGLARYGDGKVESLSLGNQQRVQLAAALVHDPELLVLDEPFSGLDPVGVDDMSEVLRERAAEGVAVLFSSHQLDLVEHLCEAVAIVHDGRLVAEGSVEELGSAHGRRLEVRVGGDPDGAWTRGLDGAVRVESVRDGLVSLVLGDGADTEAIVDAARAAGPLEHFAFARRRLSEVFRAAVGIGVGEIEQAAAGTDGPYAGAAGERRS